MTTNAPLVFTTTKAKIGAIVSGVVAALGVVAADLSNPATDWTNFTTYIPIVLAGLVASGLVGGSVYQARNKVVGAQVIGVDTGVPTIPTQPAGE